MKAVLLVPTHDEVHPRALPLGIGYIAACLRNQEYRPIVFDDIFGDADILQFLKTLKEKPVAVGISCMTPSFPKALENAKKIKSVLKVPIIFGGAHPTADPMGTIQNEEIDFVVVGEGEITMLELLKAIESDGPYDKIQGIVWKDKGVPIANKPRPLIENLDDLPFPARDLFPKWYFQRFMVIRGIWGKGTNIIGSRGCVFNCSYCSSKLVFGRKVRWRSINNIIEEIKTLIETYNIKYLSFSDDTFTTNKKKVFEFCDALRENKIYIKWRVQSRANTVDDELVKKMVESGCIQFDVGVESGSDRILKILNKGITREQVINAFNIFKKYGVRTCATFMIGNPTETIEDIEQTKSLARSIKADYTQFFITTPYPGTPMYKELKEAGNLAHFDGYSVFRHGGGNLISLINNTLQHDLLIRLQKELNNEFLKDVVPQDLIFNKNFLLDMATLLVQKPKTLFNAFYNLLKEKKIVEFYRTIYYAYNFRR